MWSSFNSNTTIAKDASLILMNWSFVVCRVLVKWLGITEDELNRGNNDTFLYWKYVSQISLPPVYTEKIFKSLLERLGSEKNTYQQEIHDCKQIQNWNIYFFNKMRVLFILLTLSIFKLVNSTATSLRK